MDPLKDLFTETARRAAEVRLATIERALTSWAAQAGVTVEEWLKLYGYTVETKWEGTELTYVVRAQADYPGQEVVMPPPPQTDDDLR